MSTTEIIDIIKTASLVIAGLWVIYNYIWKRERHPKSEFNLDIKFIDKHGDHLLLEFIANLENKGTVRQYIDVKTFILKIRYITDDDVIDNHTHLKFKDINVDFFHLSFPHSVKPDVGAKDIVWLPKEWDYIFVDAGIKQKLSLPLSIPSAAKYILIKSEFKYKNDKKSGLHTAQSIFKVDDLINRE
jgi:hypothetical protein